MLVGYIMSWWTRPIIFFWGGTLNDFKIIHTYIHVKPLPTHLYILYSVFFIVWRKTNKRGDYLVESSNHRSWTFSKSAMNISGFANALFLKHWEILKEKGTLKDNQETMEDIERKLREVERGKWAPGSLKEQNKIGSRLV